MILKQECFKTIKDFSRNSDYRKGTFKPGVYLWGFSLEKEDYTIPSSAEKFFPFYVGKHNSDMYGRTHEHISSLIGGNYSVFDILNCDLFKTKIGTVHRDYQIVSKKSIPSSGPILPHKDFPHLLHFPEGINTFYDLHVTKKNLIADQLDWMIKHFCITYFVPENPNAIDIIDLEKIIGNLIGYEKLITKKYKMPKEYKIEIINAPTNIIVNNANDLFIKCKYKMKSVKFGI